MDEQRTVELYQKHIETIFGVKKIEDFSDEETEHAFENLLKVLPNGGKLYKYRSFEKGKFEYYYDALKNGYMWFPQADNLNDDFDTVLRFNPIVEAENIKNYLIANPRLYFKAIMTYSSEPIKIGNTEKEQKAFQEVVECYDLNTGELNKQKARKLLVQKGVSTQVALKYLDEVDTFITQFILNNKDALEKVAQNFVNINLAIRRDSYIYSMSETYQSNPMWAFYSNNNQGFCIEYDFNKAKSIDLDKKKMLLYIYAVIYSNEVKEYSFVDNLKYIFTGKKDKDLYLKANLNLFTQLMTKQEDWSFEKEWRIMLNNLEDNKVPFDLVSSIVIDERVLETEEAQSLIDLCKERNWGVLIRKTQYINVAHKYEELISPR